jgi:photoactive yellow protein
MIKEPAFDPNAYKRLQVADLDALPYGVIVVDSQGIIRAYNLAESKAVGIPRERVMGRNFFTDVAPCTHVKRFYGRFQEFVALKQTSVEPFEFVFPFPAGAQRVTILFVRDDAVADRISIIVMRYEDRT